jgi:hypothetical protein
MADHRENSTYTALIKNKLQHLYTLLLRLRTRTKEGWLSRCWLCSK